MYSDDDNIKFIIIDYDKDIKIKLSNNEFHNYDNMYVAIFNYKQIITTFHLHFIINKIKQ